MPLEILTYPKTHFSRAEVIKERSNFNYPKGWELKEDNKNFYLILHKSWLDEYYLVKKQNNTMNLGRSIGKGIFRR